MGRCPACMALHLPCRLAGTVVVVYVITAVFASASSEGSQSCDKVEPLRSHAPGKDQSKVSSFALMQLRSDLDKREKVESLLDVETDQSKTVRHVFAGVARAVAHVANTLKLRWKPAGFFNGFSEDESTYDGDEVIEQNRADKMRALHPSTQGKIADFQVPGSSVIRMSDGTISSRWFDETVSGGPMGAWQTHYPALDDAHPRGTSNQLWLKGQNGRWHQDYENPYEAVAGRSTSKDAAWFDNSVTHYDAFGRVREPSEYSGRRYPNWTERARNVTLTCKDPGCTGNAKLLAYDPKKERARNCLLTISVHPTDFDDEYSREHVEFISVNGRTINTLCDPRARGCNSSRNGLLYSCVRELELPKELLLDGNGTLNITAKISKMVDECPIDGNHLSGVAAVTCLISPLPPPRKLASPFPHLLPKDPRRNSSGVWKLQCAEPGCIANVTVRLPSFNTSKNGTGGAGKCKLSIRLNQTDFDAENELVDWIKIDDKVVSEKLKLSENPCKMREEGKKPSGTPFKALTDKEVASTNAAGYVVVSVKISDMVDECGSRGYLLDGDVTVDCKPTATLVSNSTVVSSASQPKNSSAPAATKPPAKNGTATAATKPPAKNGTAG